MRIPGRIITALGMLAACLLGHAAPADAIEPFTVRIQSAAVRSSDSLVRVTVTLEEGWVSMAGFDFLIVYDSIPLTLVNVEPGELQSACGWQSFSWKAGARDPIADYDQATDTIRVRADAEKVGAPLPSCYMINHRPFVLFTLVFRPSYKPDLAGETSPIRFFWYKCLDNSILVPASPGPTPHNSVTTVGQSIFEPSGWEVTDPTHGVPGYAGPPGKCITFERESPVPFVNLVNGYVLFALDQPTGGARADLNLNGQVAEIEDSWLLAKSLLYGDSVFSMGASQLQAADIDGDGVPATIADLTLLMRLVTGEYVPVVSGSECVLHFPSDPFHPPPPRPGKAEVIVGRGTLQVESDDSLVAAHIVFDGEVRPELYPDNLDLNFAYDGHVTRVLIYGYFTNATIESGLLLHWTGRGTPRDISLATATGGPVTVERR